MRPYAIAIGQIALAWNELHEILAVLFSHMIDTKLDNQPLAMWHVLKSDRAQRDLLLAAAKCITRETIPPEFLEDVTWLCGRADVVEEARNNALHAPLWVYQKSGTKTVLPITGLGHTRAKKLLAKNLLGEFRWCRHAAIVLGDFALDLIDGVADHRLPWPDRPAWPNRGESDDDKYRFEQQLKKIAKAKPALAWIRTARIT